MKKNSSLFAVVIFMTTILCAVSCSSQEKTKLSNDVDSLSYAIGLSRTNGLTSYLKQNGIDSAYLSDFTRGFKDGSKIKEGDFGEIAYTMGKQIGQQMITDMLNQFNSQLFGEFSTEKLNKELFINGFIDGSNNQYLLMGMNESIGYVNEKVSEIQNKKKEQEFGYNKEAGISFLANNSTQEGVITLPSGLQYKVIKQGKGAIPTLTDKVKVYYSGTLIDGTPFDATEKDPAEFSVSNVIAGWVEALTLMPVGSKWMVYIPQELAYGAQQSSPAIKPFSALIFEIELLEIVK